ncbi:MAG: restriction endonuclease subunit S [Fervidicoccus fontis]|nr:MAG: restriction endonuclease subunit S [Fervidicoccus fontis]
MKADLNLTFYREEKFKETPIGKIPEDWEVVKLEKICEKIKAGGTPLTYKKEFWNGKIPFVKIEDITSAGKYLTKTSTFISEDGLENSNAWIVPQNSLLLAMYGSLGEVSINKIPVATNQAILGIIPLNKEDVEFLYYWYLYFKPNWKKYAKPTTQANLTAHIIKNSILPLPSLSERKLIAHILSTVDEAIQKTNEIIAKTERLKKGLMQELLTKGIGHKEFKDTEIGRIPKEWEVVRLGAVLSLKNGKRPKVTKGGNIPIYGANGVMGYTTEFLVDNDFTIVIGRVGASGEVHLGWGKIWVSDNAIYSKSYSRHRVYLPFIYRLLKLKNLSRFATKTTHPIITQTFLNTFPIQLPPLSEQQQIASILSAVDKKLEVERKRKEKLEQIKKALMDLLLTGKIRVKVN